jgi:hypothetical protein
MIAFTAHYYGQSPKAVENWTTSQVHEWYNEACSLENEKWKAFNKENGS